MPSSPHAAIFTVWLFGGAPGLCVVLARLSFQVPMLLSAATAGVANNRPARAIRTKVVLWVRFIGRLPECLLSIGVVPLLERADGIGVSVYRRLRCPVNSADVGRF